MENTDNPEKIELKWWEKKQGISLYQKKNQAKVEKQKKEKRELKQQLDELKKQEKDAQAKKKEKKELSRAKTKHNPPLVRSIDSLYNIDSVPKDAQEVIADFRGAATAAHPQPID